MPRRKAGFVFMNTKQLHPMLKKRGSPDVSYLQHSVDEMIYTFMAEEKIPGVSLAIVQAPYIPRVVGYGYSDDKQKRLVSSNTLFPLGPISQAYLAVALMQLYELGQLNVFAPLSSYLPEAPAAWKDIALIDLLRHASGIPDYREEKDYSSAKPYTIKDAFRQLGAKPLLFPSGTGFAESATDFLVLSEVISRVSGMSYHAYVKKNQFEALGLRRTSFQEDLGQFKNEDLTKSNFVHEIFKHDGAYIDPIEVAASYDDKGNLIPFVNKGVLQGYSDVFASSGDVSYWDIALAGGVLIHDKANRDLVYQSYTNKKGDLVPSVAGWHFYFHRGLMAIRGSVQGYSAYLSRFTHSEELVCVTLLANKEGVDFTNLARRIAAAFGDLLSTNYDDNRLYLLEGQFKAVETVARLKKALAKREIPLFAEFDHAKNAEEVGLSLRPTTVLVFGSPKAGTPLMNLDQSLALDLPLKIGVWEDEAGSTWVGFKRLAALGEEHELGENPTLAAMEKLLKALAKEAAEI